MTHVAAPEMTTYSLVQRFRYDYSAPIRGLRHRLIVVPPDVHGDQRVVDHSLMVAGASATVRRRSDAFANHVIELRAPLVERSIEFETRVTIERRPGRSGCYRLPDSVARNPRYRTPSSLTAPDAHVADAATDLRRRHRDERDLAAATMAWVAASMRYEHGMTTVRTSAWEALAAAAGVCQDYAHVMLSVVRACGLPARYVSGHLVGEGGSHAWVEVLLPGGAGTRGSQAEVVAYDPTHNRVAGSGYVTIAVGRDYADVAPTSGTFRSAATGSLSCHKRLEMTSEVAAAAL